MSRACRRGLGVCAPIDQIRRAPSRAWISAIHGVVPRDVDHGQDAGELLEWRGPSARPRTEVEDDLCRCEAIRHVPIERSMCHRPHEHSAHIVAATVRMTMVDLL